MDSRPEQNNSFRFNQLRPSSSHVHDVNTTSMVVDTSKYIKRLKERVEELNEEVAVLQISSSHQNKSSPSVKVETLEKGFRIKVLSEKTCPGLLVAVLEAFEDLGLQILDATVSCAHNFSLEAISQSDGKIDENIDGQVVKQAVLQAIGSWNQNIEQE